MGCPIPVMNKKAKEAVVTDAEEFCMKLLIRKICEVCDGDITLDELKEFRREMENEQYTRMVN